MFRYSPLITLLIILASCSSKEEPVTKEEALSLSHAIDSSINNKKPLYFNSLLDEKAFTVRVASVAGTKVSNDFNKGISTALKQSQLGDNIIRAIRTNGFYEMVKHYEKDNVQHLIFRLYSEDGLNYHDFELSKKDGKPAIADIYIYLSGENLSKTIADLFASFYSNNRAEAEEKMKQVEKIKRMKEMVDRNDMENALHYYNTLSPDLKNQKSIRLMHTIISSQLDEDSYQKSINEYMTLYPNEPNMYLMMVDTYILRKEYEKALEAINEMDKLINTDPFLDYMRALMYNMMEKPAEARARLEKLHSNMPGFDDGALELLANYIDAGDNAKARKLIKEYEGNKKYDQSLLNNYLLMKSYSREE